MKELGMWQWELGMAVLTLAIGAVNLGIFLSTFPIPMGRH